MEGERSRRILCVCVCVCDDMSAPGVLQDRTPLMVQTDDASVSSHRVRNTKILKRPEFSQRSWTLKVPLSTLWFLPVCFSFPDTVKPKRFLSSDLKLHRTLTNFWLSSVAAFATLARLLDLQQ